jgi:hypothetical protein
MDSPPSVSTAMDITTPRATRSALPSRPEASYSSKNTKQWLKTEKSN